MNYKLSYYTIVTDVVDVPNDRKILYATRTGTPILIRSKFLEDINAGNFDDLPITLMDMLIRSEALVPEDDRELKELAEKAKIASAADKTYLNFTIQTTANCQLGCHYCGQSHSKHNMSDSIIENVVKRFEHKMSEKKYSEVDISWFGGEPLMSLSVMRKLNKSLKEIAASKNCRYKSHLVSNGLSLKQNVYEELALDMNCTFIDITLDGISDSHDKRRMTKSNENTFDIIFNNIVSIVNRPDYPLNGCTLSVRCNVDSTNIDQVEPLINLLLANELQNKINFYFAPIYSWGNDAHLATNKDEIAIKEIDWFIKLFQNGFKPTLLPKPKQLVCSAVNPDYELVDPWGKVYNCTETPLVPFYGPEHVIGNVNNSTTEVRPFKDRPFTDWYDKIQDPSNGYYCTSCKILPLCGGRCPKSWTEGIPACPSMKFNMEDRLILSYVFAKSNFEQLTQSTYENNII